MAPNPRVLSAFRAMRNLGISEEKVKPVLKNLLKLYDKNWELIEEENYRALVDAIFETEEMEAAENRKKLENSNQEKELVQEAQAPVEVERPLKRLRLKHQDNQASSLANSNSTLTGTTLKKPKVEVDELGETCPEQETDPEIRRTGASSVPSQPLARNKGKRPVSSQTSPGDGTKRNESNPSRGNEPILTQSAIVQGGSDFPKSFRVVRFKERKAGVGSSPPTKQNAYNNLALIKPKDEPFTDEIPQFEPLEPLGQRNSSSGNEPVREPHGQELVVSRPLDENDAIDGVPVSSTDMRVSSELAKVPGESGSTMEIASSPLGEVKISLSCNPATRRPDFHMPSLDTVMKAVEDKCLKSYKFLDPSFSVKKLMEEMCECFLELGTDSSTESRETVNDATNIDSSKNNSAAHSVVAGVTPVIPLNGTISIQSNDKVAIPEILRLPPPLPCNDMEDSIQTISKISGNNCENEKELDGLKLSDSQSIVVFEKNQSTEDVSFLDDVYDIAKGHEKVIISLENTINCDCPPSFHYIPQNVVFQNAYVNFSLARIGDSCCSTCLGDCLSSSTPCACSHETGGEYAYTSEGLVKEELLEECISMNHDPQKHCLFYCKECPLERSKNDDILEPCKGHLVRKFIKECWWKCGCSKQCGNRVVQRGINRKLQVFMTRGKGWGLRTLEDLPKGAFVCEYVGEVLTNAELYDRVSRSCSNQSHAYPVLLDADWGSEGVLKDEEALCLDATHYGNVARFINHRCFDSTLVEIPVEVETPDHHYYHLAFFTTRKVDALEELTWDYGIDFDDHEHPVKAFRCRCGSKFCRNIKRSSRSRSVANNR